MDPYGKMVWLFGVFNTIGVITVPLYGLLLAAPILMGLVCFLMRIDYLAQMVYSGTRFFTEFLRCEPRVFHGFKTYQLLCLGGVLVGALEYLLVCVYHARVRKKEDAAKDQDS